MESYENELAVISSVLLIGAGAVERLTVDDGLRAEHFHNPRHRLVFGAMVALADAGDAVDVRTVADHLQLAGRLDAAGGTAGIDGMASFAPSAEHYSAYAKRVYRDAIWRGRSTATRAIEQAIAARDEEAFVRAEGELTAREDLAGLTTWEEDTFRHEVFEYVNAREGDAIPTSSAKLNELLHGGFRRGDVTFTSGFTSMGKSSWVDGELEHVSDVWQRGRRLRSHLLMNEMALISRALRLTSSMSGVPFGRLLRRDLEDADYDAITEALRGRVPFSMTNCAGWRIERICRLIRAKRWDVVAIDSANLIPHKGIDEIDAISGELCAVAQQADCHLIVVGLLNRSRVDSPILPPPAEGDIRETGKIAYDAANLLFVHRDQEMITLPMPDGSTHETGEARKLDTGILRLDKARNGEPGRAYVRLNRRRMRFEDLPSNQGAFA